MCHRPIPHRLQRSVARRATARPSTPPPTNSPTTGVAQLADEAEALVNGELVKVLTAAGRPLPSWVALNRLGHAPPEVLTRVVCNHPSETPDPEWAAAERSLARRLLSGHRDPNDVRYLQREVLVPLELGLIIESGHRRLSVDEVMTRAREALDEHQSRGPRPV